MLREHSSLGQGFDNLSESGEDGKARWSITTFIESQPMITGIELKIQITLFFQTSSIRTMFRPKKTKFKQP